MEPDPLIPRVYIALLSIVFIGASAGAKASAKEVPKIPTQEPTATASPMPTNSPTPTASPSPTPQITQTPTTIEILPLWSPATVDVYCTDQHLVTHKTWMTGHPIYSAGAATFYAPGVMEATAYVRGMSLEGFVDGVSLMSPIDIGQEVWIKHDGRWEGPFLSVDTAQQNHMCQAIQTRGEVIEVGYRTAQRWGMTDWPKVHEWKTYVEVSLVPPEELDKYHISVVDFPRWWTAQAELLP